MVRGTVEETLNALLDAEADRGMALALAAQPSMLLLDEPVSGMNPSETVKVMALVEAIRASGVTILLVEHDMSMVMQVSDRIVVLNYGRSSQKARRRPSRKIPTLFALIWGEGRKPPTLLGSAQVNGLTR
jgi:branched-chain amino acid transport system ATP-binding protein